MPNPWRVGSNSWFEYNAAHPFGCLGCALPVLLGAFGLGVGLAHLWALVRRC